MKNNMIKNQAKMVAIGCCVLAMTGVVSAEAKTTEEIEQESLEVVTGLATAAEAGDYNTFHSFYGDSAGEEEVKANFEFDWSQFTKKDQHFATVLVEMEPYYLVNITGAICSGYYPDASSAYADWNVSLQDTGDGLIVIGSQTDEARKAVEQLKSLYIESLPEGMVEAFNEQKNVTEFGASNWHWNENRVINGSLENMLKYAWQDEEGNLYLGLLIANGTNANRCFTSVQVTLTDDNLGTVYEGSVEDYVTRGSFNLQQGKNDLVICKIPAEKVLTGTQKWGSMNNNVHTNTL